MKSNILIKTYVPQSYLRVPILFVFHFMLTNSEHTRYYILWNLTQCIILSMRNVNNTLFSIFSRTFTLLLAKIYVDFITLYGTYF